MTLPVRSSASNLIADYPNFIREVIPVYPASLAADGSSQVSGRMPSVQVPNGITRNGPVDFQRQIVGPAHMTISEVSKAAVIAKGAPAVVLFCCLGVLVATGWAGVRPLDGPSETEHRALDPLVAVEERISVMSTAIDNGDVEGMFSTTGASVELLIAKRIRLSE